MKKNILFLIVALFAAATVLTSCDSKDEPTPPPTPAKFEYKAPCLAWHCTIDEVRAFMKNYAGFEEDDAPYKDMDGNMVYLFSDKSNVNYDYAFNSDGLVHSTVVYPMGDNFDKFKEQLAKTHGITGWTENTISGQVSYTATLKGKKTDVSLSAINNFMIADFKYTEFDW